VNGKNVFAVLHYEGAPNADPTVSPGQASGVQLQEFQLHALENPGAPGGSGPADHVIDLKFGRGKTANDTLFWEINGIQYQSPDLPTLLEILNGARKESDFTRPEHTFVLKRDEIVELHVHGSANGHGKLHFEFAYPTHRLILFSQSIHSIVGLVSDTCRRLPFTLLQSMDTPLMSLRAGRAL
jgi:hypothetical protein